MALLLNTLNEAVVRETNCVPAANDYSCSFWWKPTLTTATYKLLFGLFDDYTVEDEGIGIYGFISGITSTFAINFSVFNSGGNTDGSTEYYPLLNKWFHIGYTRSGTTHSLYVNGALISTATKDVSGDTYADTVLGADGFGSTTGDEFQYFREWNDRVLTLAEIIAEANSPTNVSATDIETDTPLVNDLLDDSGNTNDWTAIGSTSFITAPTPLPATNITFTPDTAKEITVLTEQYIQLVRNSTGLTLNMWFKYTGAVGELLFSVWAQGYGSTYDPTVRIVDDTGATYNGISNYPDNPIEVPFATLESTLYIRVIPPAGNPAGVLWIQFAEFTQQTAPAGSLFIPDDTSGLWTLIDESNGDPLQIRPNNRIIQEGIGGPNTSNNNMLLTDLVNSEVVILDANLNEVTVVPVSTSSIEIGAAEDVFITTNRVAGNTEINIIDLNGNVLSTQLIGGFGVTTMTPNQIADIMYTAASAVGSPVRRWSLSSEAFLSDLVVGEPGYFVRQLLWLNDNTLLVAYGKSGPTDLFVKRFDCDDGSLLNTYSTQFDDAVVTIHQILAIAADDPTSFWGWCLLAGGQSRIMNIRTSDGVILSQFTRDNFSGGSNNNSDPEDMYGHNQTCPLITTTTEIPGNGELSTGTIIVVKVTDPQPDATSFDFEAGGGLTPTTFSLAHGNDQTFNDVPIGSGYSISETPVAGYSVSYNVSNGSPIDNITVAGGETVTITVTNSKVGRIVVQKALANSVSEVLFEFLAGGGLDPTSFSIRNGEEFIFENVPVGDGYTLEEINLPTGFYLIEWNISNGSLLTNLVVEADTDTIVQFINIYAATTLSGIYVIEKDKREDTLWLDMDGETPTIDVKIPDPTVRTGPLGG